MRTITFLFFAVTAFGREPLLAPPAAVVSRAVARIADRVVVAEATLTGARAVISDFDGHSAQLVSLSSNSSTAAAAASDGHDFLITWIEQSELHAAILHGGAIEPVAIDASAGDGAPLVTLFDRSRYLALWRGGGAFISTAGVVEERFALSGPPILSAAAADGRVIVAWQGGDGTTTTINVAELRPDHTLASEHVIAKQVLQFTGGQWWVHNPALAVSGPSGLVLWAHRAGRAAETMEGSPITVDLAPLKVQPLNAAFSTFADHLSVRVMPFGAEFLVLWQFSSCFCPYDGAWASEVNSDGTIRSLAQLRRGGLTPAAVELPGNRAAVVYGTSDGVVLRVVTPAARRRAITR